MNTEGPAVSSMTPVDTIDPSTNPVLAYVPDWVFRYGKDDEAGIMVDDHCLVVLFKNWLGQWGPATHIPREVAMRLPEYAEKL